MSGIERVLEIAASTRVLHERRLAALGSSERGALLGREFVTFRGFAERCAAETGVAVRAVLDGAASRALVALCARGSIARQLAERRGLAAALAASLRDLRDAGVQPRDLPSSHADLRATWVELERAFEALASEGIFDRVGLFRLALRGADTYLARRGVARIEVHGATELVGSVGDLLARAAESLPGERFRFFQPDTQSAYAARLREEWPWRFTPEPVEVVDRPALTPDGEIPEGVLELRSARSPREELEGIAREVLGLLEAGTPASEIQIVARSLEPYAPWLEATLHGYGIPFTSSLAPTQLARPSLRAWLDLAKALGRELERGPVVRLFSSPELRAPADLAPALAALAERSARRHGVVRGERDWRAALAGSGSPERSLLARWIDRLAAASAELGRAADFSAAVATLRTIGAELFGAESAEFIRPTLDAVALLDRVRAAAGGAGAPALDELPRALEAALAEASATPFAEDDGGVRVLDAVQARAVPCAHLFLAGCINGVWPRPLYEDPFLPDALREKLRARSKRPVPVASRSSEEERFLFGLLLSQARVRVTLSYFESDSLGRAQTASSLLRELPFVAPRTDVLAGEATLWNPASPRFVRPAAALAGAVRAADPDCERIAERLSGVAAFRAGRELVTRTDALDDTSLPYDGEVAEALRLPAELPATALEELGQCPLRTLWKRLLSVRALEAPGADELEANEIGSFIHRALESVYAELFASGALRPGTAPAESLSRARAALPGALGRATADSERKRVTERHPTVWRAFIATVSHALEDFLARDLEALLPAGLTRLDTERPVTAPLPAAAPELLLRGTVDRIAGLADGTVRVGDYKTGRQFGKPLERARIARGAALQLPLYARLVAGAEEAERVIAEVLTVPLRPERDRDGEREKERARSLAELDALSARPIAELAGLLARGFYPITSDENECRFCDYTVACRIRHPPTRARIERSEQGAGYFSLREE